MDTRHRVLAALVILTVVAAIPAVAVIADHAAPIQGDVPVTTGSSPTITVGAASDDELDFLNLFEDDELNITTTEGQIRVGGDPGASARIDSTAMEGAQTEVTEIDAGPHWLELNPADKNRVDVRGDADTLAFSEIAADDGSTDIQIGGTIGGTAELRLHGLDASTTYGLYDPSRDEVLGTIDTDVSGSGSGEVSMPDGTHSLEVWSIDATPGPTLSNPVPEGEVSERPDEIAIDVGATAFPTTVEFELEGEPVGSTTVTENGTVTADVSAEVDALGTYNWSATATDELGQTDTREVTFQTPDTLTVREEHNPSQIIDNTTLSIRFYTAGGDIAIERPIENGTLDMEGLPISEFVLFAESPEHYDRRVYLDSIFEQQNVYLLNETEFPRGNNSAVRSRFVYEDLTGSFPRSDTTIQVQRAIDIDGDGESQFETVAGDFWGAAGEFETVLERGEQYMLVVKNQETGETNRLGSHIPTEDLTQELRVSGLSEEALNASGVVGLASLNSDGDIEIVYRDPAERTGALTVTVENQPGTETLYSDTIPGPLGTYMTTVELNETQAETDWVVRFDGGDRHTSAVPVGEGTIGLPTSIPAWILTLLASMIVTFVGGLYGPRTALLGAWSMVFVAAGIAMFGWAFSGASIAVAGLVAVGATLYQFARF